MNDNDFNYGLVNVTDKEFLLIIDGSSLLSTQFYGNLPKEIMFAKTVEEKEKHFGKIMQTSTGIYTNAVYGFMRVLLKIIKEQKPDYLAVAWDINRNTFRKELYADYKGNRTETIEPLRLQFILCQEVLNKMNVVQFMDERFEADDFSGTLAKKFENEVYIRILTKDNDYLQLVTEKTNLWMLHSTQEKTEELYDKYNIDHKKLNSPDRTFQFTPELVNLEFKVKPSSINSLKGIQGDTSDNIKGVPGVGKDTAAALIAKYETVDNLYKAINSLDDKGRKELANEWKTELGLKRSPMNNLIKTSDNELVGEKAARLSEKLATIKCDIEINTKLEELKINIDKENAAKEFERLEFKSLKNALKGDSEIKEDFMNLPVDSDGFVAGGFNPFEEDSKALDADNDIFTEDNADLSSKIKLTEEMIEKSIENYTTINSKLELENLFKEVSSGIAVFPVVSGETFISCAITAENKNAFINFTQSDKNITSNDFEEKLLEFSKNGGIAAFYDMKKNLGIFPAIKKYFDEKCSENVTEWFDIMLAGYLINPIKESYLIEELSEEYLGYKPETVKTEGQQLSLFFNEEETIKKYLIRSTLIFHMYTRFSEILKKQDMDKLFTNIEMPLLFVLYDMQCKGISVKKEELNIYAEELYKDIEKLEGEIYNLCGEKFNINSPKQLGVILFEKLNLTAGKKTKSGYSTSADILEKIAQEHPVVKKILEYRQLSKLYSTYAIGLAKYIKEDGKIHGTFNQTVTATGRISSTEPNLQNIPIKLELGRRIRKVFIPENGNVFLDADYSQIELRVLAHMSKDNELIEAYKSGRDIHAITASQVFHIPFDEVTKELRGKAKAVNFGIVYGISSFGLGDGLNISTSEAKEYIDKYFETYPKVKIFLDGLISSASKKGYVKTLYNRRRQLPDINNSNFRKKSAEERIAMNTPIQGTAADIIKIAMVKVYLRLKKECPYAKLLLQIHDELLVEAPAKYKEQVSKIMNEEMENATELLVPLIAEVSVGNNWYEAK